MILSNRKVVLTYTLCGNREEETRKTGFYGRHFSITIVEESGRFMATDYEGSVEVTEENLKNLSNPNKAAALRMGVELLKLSWL